MSDSSDDHKEYTFVRGGWAQAIFLGVMGALVLVVGICVWFADPDGEGVVILRILGVPVGAIMLVLAPFAKPTPGFIRLDSDTLKASRSAFPGFKRGGLPPELTIRLRDVNALDLKKLANPAAQNKGAIASVASGEFQKEALSATYGEYMLSVKFAWEAGERELLVGAADVGGAEELMSFAEELKSRVNAAKPA